LPVRGERLEVLRSAAFADAHGIRPGDRGGAIVRGTLETLHVGGLARSPESTNLIAPGRALPDDRRSGVIRMPSEPLAAAVDMAGAFNDVLVRRSPGATATAADTAARTLPSIMRILLTNDDGINAPGIEALHAALDGLGEIVPIAPATVQSATSHGITFHDPIRVDEVRVNERMVGTAVDGRPADCVKLALRAIWPERFGEGARPDLTISGMNAGANVGINVIYSGTVGAAVESAFLGVPAIAVSLHLGDRTRTHWARAAEIARHAIDRILEHELDPHRVVNVNVPRTETADAPIPPMKVVHMNTAAGTDGYEQRTSPYGQTYYWASGSGLAFAHTSAESDVEALLERFVTVTPLQFDLTDHARMATWADRLGAG